MPRVVTAGVPMRMPLVIKGLWVSKGIVFLLTVMPACSSAFLRVFSGNVQIPQINQHHVIVGAAGN